jgi:hypothetical protein
VSLLVTSCTIFKSRKSTSTSSTQVVTKDSTSKKDSVSIKSSLIGNSKDSTQEETKITEEITETVFDTSGKVVVEKKTKKVTEKKKKSGSETKTESKKDSTSVKTEVKKHGRDSTEYRHQETIKTKKSFSMPWIIWLLLLALLVWFLYKRFKNRFLLFLPFLFIGCKKDIQNEPKLEVQGNPSYQLYMTNMYGQDTCQGISSTFQWKGLGGNGSTLKGVWLAATFATPTGNVWVQLGNHQWGGPSFFSMMFYSTVKGYQLAPWPQLNVGEYYRFHLRIENGNVYQGINGVDYGMLPINATHIISYHVTEEAEGTTNKAPSFPTIHFSKVFELFNGTTWREADKGFYSGSPYGVTVHGPNNASMGSGIKTKPPQYTQIW